MKERNRMILRFGLFALLAGAMIVVFLSGGDEWLSLKRLADNRELLSHRVEENIYLMVMIFMLVYIVAIALSVPGGAVLTIAGGFLFGLALGVLLAVVSATIGAVILFLIARTTLGKWLSERAQTHVQGGIAKLQQGFQRNAFSYLLFLRLVPVFPFWLVNLAPALLGVPLSVYVISTFIGIIPGSFAFTFFGRGLESILIRHQEIYDHCLKQNMPEHCDQTPAIGDLLTPEIIISLCVLGVVALIPVFLKKTNFSKKTME